MKVEIEWTLMDNEDDELWDNNECLYAYVHPEDAEILYVGKADGTTVKERFVAADKDILFRFLKKHYRVGPDDLDVIIGEIWLEEDASQEDTLLADLESLLIFRLRPSGNIKNIKSRSFFRPGMRVKCTGDWPLKKRVFVDR